VGEDLEMLFLKPQRYLLILAKPLIFLSLALQEDTLMKIIAVLESP